MSKSKAKTDVLFKDFLRAKKRAKNYQVVLDRETLLVSELTHAEALIALCNSIDAVEALSESMRTVDCILNEYIDNGEVSE